MVLISVVRFGVSHALLEIVRLCNCGREAEGWLFAFALHFRECAYMDMDQCLICHMTVTQTPWHCLDVRSKSEWHATYGVSCIYVLRTTFALEIRRAFLWYPQSECSVPYLLLPMLEIYALSHSFRMQMVLTTTYVFKTHRRINRRGILYYHNPWRCLILGLGGLTPRTTVSLIRWSTVANTTYVKEAWKRQITEYQEGEEKEKKRQHWIHHSCISA